jgi:hypothetical protein
MSSQQISPTISCIQNAVLLITTLPMLAFVAETLARNQFGWTDSFFSSQVGAAGALAGGLLMTVLRLFVDWRRSALDLRLHGPMSVGAIASGLMCAGFIDAILTGAQVNTYAVAFFAGVFVACLVLMVLAPSKLSS